MSRPIDGRVFITWPAATARPTALSAWGCAFEDADTGEAIVDAVAMSMQLGSAEGFDSSAFIEVELTRLVDADGNTIGNGVGSANRLALTPEYEAWNKLQDATGPLAAFVGQKFRTKAFRYIVAEMRVAPPKPATPIPPVAAGAKITHVEPGHESTDARELLRGARIAWAAEGPIDQYGRALPAGVPVIVGDGNGCELSIPDGT